MRLTAEEKTNRDYITKLIKEATAGELEFDILPYGCNVEIRCEDIYYLEVIEVILNDAKKTNMLNPIRGSIRLTFNKFFK